MEMENKDITVREATNHGNNQFMVAFLSIISAMAFLGLVAELNLFQRLDDGIIFLLGVAAAIWYFGGRHRYQRSFTPLALLIASLVVKVIASFMESSNPTDLDDFPLGIALIIGLIISIVMYVRSRDKAAARDTRVLTLSEAINRGNNQLMVSLMAVTFPPLIFAALGEDNLVDRLDDGLIVLMAIIGIVWYFVGRNRYHHSFTPLALVLVSFIAQAAGLFLESGDPLGEGIDDIVLIFAFTMGVILSIIIYSRSRQTATLAETPPISQIGS
jgi:peptidoglycan/LPS O-acetylase OafA/YrhL